MNLDRHDTLLSKPLRVISITCFVYISNHLYPKFRDTYHCASREVYVIYDRQKDGVELFEGKWQTDPAWKWDGSNPDGIGLYPPPGLYEPKRGFGWLWRTHLGAADGPLGWALDKEYGFDNTGQVQAFEQGIMFKGSSPKLYILLNNEGFFAK